MTSSSQGDITQLLIAWSKGDQKAFNELIPLVYNELRCIAKRKLRQYGSGRALQPTELVHEAYLNLVSIHYVEWKNRAHFYKFASSLIRNILVDEIRATLAQKRGGSISIISIDEDAAGAGAQNIDLLTLNEVLERLAKLDPRQVAIIEMRFFGDLTLEEIAEALGIGLATVKREWRAAKAWLYSQLL
jgi:RNA polymerase sigma-70 factor, ECF subfamily